MQTENNFIRQSFRNLTKTEQFSKFVCWCALKDIDK